VPINIKPKKGKKGPEKQVQDTILQWLRLNGCLAIRVNQGGFFDKRGHYIKFTDEEGVSDIIACVPTPKLPGMMHGQFCAIECKAGRGVPSDKQEAFLRKVGDAYGVRIVAYTLEDVQNVLHWLPNR